eukprot:1825557-Amphidinium_carterae.1
MGGRVGLDDYLDAAIDRIHLRDALKWGNDDATSSCGRPWLFGLSNCWQCARHSYMAALLLMGALLLLFLAFVLKGRLL